jgi:hypothetical protein
MSKLTGSKKATQFTESVIREMTRLNQLHGGEIVQPTRQPVTL